MEPKLQSRKRQAHLLIDRSGMIMRSITKIVFIGQRAVSVHRLLRNSRRHLKSEHSCARRRRPKRNFLSMLRSFRGICGTSRAYVRLDRMDAIYINRATGTAELTLPFYEETEGVRNLMTAAQGLEIQYIAKSGALGTYPPARKNIKDNIVLNIIRMEGHKIIEQSGVPHTFFAPTHFMELLPYIIDGRALQWIGNTNVKVYWISVADYARQVVKAFQNPSKMRENCPVQEPEALRQAMEQFVQNYDPSLNIRIAPLWVIRMIGLLEPKMKFATHLLKCFVNYEDPFYAKKTWQELGKPTTTIEIVAKTLRQKQAAI